MVLMSERKGGGGLNRKRRKYATTYRKTLFLISYLDEISLCGGFLFPQMKYWKYTLSPLPEQDQIASCL